MSGLSSRAGQTFCGCLVGGPAEEPGSASDELRLTRLGKLLRRTSFDELPQLWSVVQDKMSLVGPRPLLPEYLALYNERQRRRHAVKPGIAGWAQVNGRNEVDWEQRFEMDLWYVEHCSFLPDPEILAMTSEQVFRGTGVTRTDYATVPRFKGAASQEAVEQDTWRWD